MVSILSLGGAGILVASRLTESGLEKILVASVLGVAAAVVESLAFGLVGLGTSQVALPLAAITTWGICRWRLPATRPSLYHHFVIWWTDRSIWQRMATGAATGSVMIYAAWILRYPRLGYDAISYHLPEVINWVHSGRTGSPVPAWTGFVTSAYPLTNEVALSWGVGISRSLVFAVLWSPALWLLLGLSVYCGLRRLGLDAGRAVLASVALLITPLMLSQVNDVGSDLPVATWFACTASLCAGTIRKPVMLVPAIVAFGMEVGTKPTMAALALALLAACLIGQRAHLRQFTVPLIVATLTALVVGGTWYLRNTIEYGSPFWPFLTVPWGPGAPAVYPYLDKTFLSSPGRTLSVSGSYYLHSLAGAMVFIAWSVLAPLFVRRRQMLGLSLLVIVGLLLWAASPATGLVDSGLSTIVPLEIRYILPLLSLSVAGIALVVRLAPRATRMATLALFVSIGWNLFEDHYLTFPLRPSLRFLIPGMLVGAVASAVFGERAMGPRHLGRSPVVAGASIALIAIIAITLESQTFIQRRVSSGYGPELQIAAFLARQDTFRSDHRTVAMNSVLSADLSGDYLQHDLYLIPPRAPCSSVVALRQKDWVVVASYRSVVLETRPLLNWPVPTDAASCLAAIRPTWVVGTYSVYRPST